MPGRVVVQYDKRDVETIKLIKLDLLGLRMLSAIDDALRDIAADCAVCVDLDRLPEDIPEVFRMIQAADTVGVFQIESRAQMQTLPRSRPETLDDLVVEVAIIRPGPIQGNAVHPYLRRRQGIEPVTYLHPSLEPALEETLGVILYQEQVMKIAIDVAGFSAAELDGFRRAMGTWRSSREMEKLHARFVEGCITGNGLTPEQAEELFRQVAGLRQLRLQQEPRRGLRAHRVRIGLPEALLPGPVRGRAHQRPADGLLPRRGAHQRRQAPRRGGAAGGRQPQPLPDDDRVGRAARRAAARGRRHRRRPEVVRSLGLRRARHEGARPLGGADARSATASASGCTWSRASARRRGRRSTPSSARGGPYHVAGRPRRAHRAVRGGRRAAHPGRRAGLARASRGASCCGSCARSPRGRVGRPIDRLPEAQGRPLDLRLPPTQAPDLPPPDRARAPGRRLRDPLARRPPPGDRAVPAGARRLGVLTVGELARCQAGRVRIGGLVVTRQHPMTAQGHGLPGARGRDRHGQRHALAGHLGALPADVRRHALLYVEGTLQRESSVVNLVARRIRPLAEVCRPAGGPEPPDGVRHMGHAGMRRQG